MTLWWVAASLAVVWYGVACVVWPFTSCRRCKGRGKHRSPSGRSWRPCGRCRGSGTRLRVGAWLFHTISHRD